MVKSYAPLRPSNDPPPPHRKQLDLPAGATYVSSKWTKGSRGTVTVGQTVTWTNLAFKPNQKRCVSPVRFLHEQGQLQQDSRSCTYIITRRAAS